MKNVSAIRYGCRTLRLRVVGRRWNLSSKVQSVSDGYYESEPISDISGTKMPTT